MRGILILLTLAGVLLLGAKTMAQSGNNNITLGWSPSSSTGVAGYCIYYGTNSNNLSTTGTPVPVYGATNVTIRGLATGQTYYFAAASVDSNFNSSALSPIISTTIGSVAQAAAVLNAAIGLPAGQFGFALTGAAGARYIVQASTDLVHWVSLQTNVAPFQFIDSNRTQFTRRFYRTASIAN